MSKSNQTDKESDKNQDKNQDKDQIKLLVVVNPTSYRIHSPIFALWIYDRRESHQTLGMLRECCSKLPLLGTLIQSQ